MARFTLEEIRVLDDVDGSGPQWRTLIGDEEGARTFDMLALGSGVLAAERDVPEGPITTAELSFDLDEAPEPNVVPLATGSSGVIVMPLPTPLPKGGTVHLDIDWDLAASLVRDAQGQLVLQPTATVKVMP